MPDRWPEAGVGGRRELRILYPNRDHYREFCAPGRWLRLIRASVALWRCPARYSRPGLRRQVDRNRSVAWLPTPL